MLYAIVAVLVILADQMIKLYVSAEGFKTMPLIPGILNLTKVENTGGAFGLLGGEIPTYWFIIIAAVFTILVVIALSTRFIKGWLARWSIVLVTAGGISNCIDRVINVRPTGHVVDMFQFDFWKSFPVFNLADVFISLFCIVFIFAVLFGRGDKGEEDVDDEFAEEEDEEEEEEEVRPVKKSRKTRKAVEEDEELDEEEDLRPARKSRKARQSKYDEEYEQYKAAQRAKEEAERAAAAAAAEAEKPAPAPAPVPEAPKYDAADPFAEWERANAARQPDPRPFTPAPIPAEEKTVQTVARRSDLDAAPEYTKPVQQAQPVEEAPAPRPVRRPAPTPVVEEPASFDLDDILAEFK